MFLFKGQSVSLSLNLDVFQNFLISLLGLDYFPAEAESNNLENSKLREEKSKNRNIDGRATNLEYGNYYITNEQMR